MFCLWNFCLVLSIALPLSHDVVALADEGIQAGSDKFGPDTVDLRSLPLSWPPSSSEPLDSQGVIGEYDGLPESTQTTVIPHGDEELVSSQPTSSSEEEATGDATTTAPEQHRSGSFLVSVRSTSKHQSASPAAHFEMDLHSQQLPLSGSPDQVFTGESRGHATPAVAPGHLGRTAEPPINSQRRDILEPTTDARETFNTGAGSELEDTGEGPPTLAG